MPTRHLAQVCYLHVIHEGICWAGTVMVPKLGGIHNPYRSERVSPGLWNYDCVCGISYLSYNHLWFALLIRVQERTHTPAMQANWLYLESLAPVLWSRNFLILMRGGLDHSLVTVSELFKAEYLQWLTESVIPLAKLLMIGLWLL